MSYSFDPGSARELGYGVGPESRVPSFIDRQGRYASFRGVNFAGRTKRWPYLPVDISPDTDDFDRDFSMALSALQPEFDRIRDLGWNVVRLLVLWKGLEPAPSENAEVLSPEGAQYMSRVLEFIRAFHERGVFVFLDFHQDIAHEVYNGEGFPDWALAIDEDHKRPTDADFKHSTWGSDYTGAPRKPWGPTWHTEEVRFTLRSFWLDELHNDELSGDEAERARRPRTHLAKTIGAVARWLQANAGPALDAMIGFQLFNEPHQVGLGKAHFEESVLPVFYQEATQEIRRAAGGLPGDEKSFVLIQPRVDWNVLDADVGDWFMSFTLDPKTYLFTDHMDNEKTIFSYHHYDPWTSTHHLSFNVGDRMEHKEEEWPALYDKMRGAAAERGMIPFMTEFGANCAWDHHYTSLRPQLYEHKQTRAYIDLQMQQAERQVLNWTYWHYNPYNTQEGLDVWNNEDFSLLGAPGSDGRPQGRNHDLVCRPYPQRSSAEPLTVHFDAGTRVAVMSFRGTPVEAPTVVYVPRRLHYTGDFDVRVSSRRVEWDEDRQLLYWWPERTATRHALILSQADVLPWPLARLLPRLLLLTPYRIRLPAGTAVQAVTIQAIVYDPPGRDIGNERVLISNPTEQAVELGGWSLSDRAGHHYTLPPHALPAGSTMKVWTKHGEDAGQDLFMNRHAPIWNNRGDDAILTDNTGNEVSRFAY